MATERDDDQPDLEIDYPDQDGEQFPVYYRSSRQESACDGLLVLDLVSEPPRLYAKIGRYQGEGIPERVWHHRVLEWKIRAGLDAGDVAGLLDDAEPFARRVVAGYTDHWTGNGYVGRFDEDATDARGDIHILCQRTMNNGDVSGPWQPDDYLRETDAQDLVQPGESLTAAVERIADEAGRQRIAFDEVDCTLEVCVRDRILRQCGECSRCEHSIPPPPDDADWGAWVREKHLCQRCQEEQEEVEDGQTA